MLDAYVMRLVGCALTMDDVEAMTHMWGSGDFSRNEVQRLRETAMEAPQPPQDRDLLKEIESFDTPDAVDVAPLSEVWRLLAANRAVSWERQSE